MKTINVIKRDGNVVSFDSNKIFDAIYKASVDTKIGLDVDLAKGISDQVEKEVEKMESSPTVEMIQDMVEEALMESNRKDIARKYILFRNKRTEVREDKSSFMRLYDSIVQIDDQDLMQENANVDGQSPMGQMGKIGFESAKLFAKKRMMSPRAKDAVANNIIHIHDLDFMPTGTTTCLSSDTLITIQNSKGEVSTVNINHFDDMMKDDRVDLDQFHVLSRDGWTKIKNVVRRRLKEKEVMYEIKTRKSLKLKATEDHKIPVIRDGQELLLFTKEIKRDDLLIRPDYEYTSEDSVLNVVELLKDIEDLIVVNISQLKKYLNYKYGISNLYKHIGSNTSKRGNQYLTMQDYYKLKEELYIPEDVILGLRIRAKHSKKSLPLNLPITPELARFIGYLMSDGSVYINKNSGSYNFTITNISKTINQDVEHVIESVFNDTPSMRIENGEEYGRVLCGKVYHHLLKALEVKVNSFEMKVPDFIVNGSEEIKANFLRALYDGDGHIAHDRITYASVSKDLTDQLVLILQSLGIESSASVRNTKGQTGEYKGVSFTRNGDINIVNIMTKDSMSAFNQLVGNLLKQEVDPDYSYTMNSKRVAPTEVEYIREIEYEGYVYDVETSDHWFVADGIIVHNCCQIPLGKLLETGFNTGHGHMRTPQSIGSAASLTAIILQANQNMQHGGQSMPAIDYDLAPYVKKTYEKHLEELKTLFVSDIAYKKLSDLAWKYTTRDTEQAMEGFIHNMNSMNSRSAGQVPFTSINYGTDTSKEGRLIIASVLKATEAGLGKGETPIFPIQIFKVKEGVNFNPEDPNYDLLEMAAKVTSKRLFPNFSFIDAPYNLEKYVEGEPDSEIAYMGCRTRVLANINGKEIVEGRGNLSFTTINLVKLALLSKGDMNSFYKGLDEAMEVSKDQLLDRYKFQCKKQAKNFKFLMGQGVWMDSEKLSKDDTLEDVLKHGTLSVGFIGLAEALVALTGKHHGEDENSAKLGLEIISHMRERMDEYVKEYKLNFSLLATPSEGTAGKYVKSDRVEFGEIEGVTDREYYTNSFHVPVYHQIGVAAKIETEAPYHALTNAGHITYVELDGNASQNPEAIMEIVRVMKETGVGYGSINHPVDRCPLCGFGGIIGNECPECHVKESDGVQFDRIRRISK